ncbi:hypothetical protein [Mucilaginibacter sp. dw_454]|uniref:carboxypeptidase-like regulatory domain-containing protein n=1 Tax=Mucilaginibacter sp. dw_454 TaxID=2720079 RepID=UPI001BD253C0|nr:hypothetical protein [Mucilaginibacter sp. dw_454]
MRSLLAIVALFICVDAYGQQINGIITDKQSGRLISGALITSSKATVLSDFHGQFTIAVKIPGDTIHVTMQGYKLYQIPIPTANATLIIALDKQAIQLKEVNISGQRDRLADSLATRREFAKSFNSAAPKFSDVVKVGITPGLIPLPGIAIIPSQLVRAITYKHSREYKFKKTLVKDENDKYIDSRFNKTLVTQITNLKDDSLSDFMERYRPTAYVIKKMTDYEVRIYIKKSLIGFKSGI